MNDQMKKELIKNTKYGGSGKRPYQTIGDIRGSRNMEYRYKFMGLPKSMKGKTVLDIGCNAGMVCMEAKNKGAYRVVGIDSSKKMIRSANKFFKESNCDAELYSFNVDDGLDSLKELIGDDKFDYVFILAVWKLVKKPILWDMVNYYCTDTCWFEGHNKQKEDGVKTELMSGLSSFSSFDFIGYINDEGVRPIFRITK